MTMWEQTILGQPLHDWIVALAIAAGGWLAGQLVYRLSAVALRRWTRRTTTRLDDLVVSTLQGPAVVLITLFGFLVAYENLEFPDQVDRWMSHVYHAALALCVTWLVVRVVKAVLREYLFPYARRNGSQVDESLLPTILRTVSIILWGLGLIVALNNVGYDVSALLAGIGISGLALAMAAKDTVANVFGGITVFADRPFRVGDRIRIDSYDGTVMHVGIRSTRIRTLEGPILVIPNFKFTDTILQNVSEESARRVRHELGLTYDTTPERIEEAIALLRAIVQDHQDDLMPEHAATFQTFGDWSLTLVFVYHIRRGRSIEEAQTRVNLEVLKRFTAHGLQFAYPTQVQLSEAPKA